jgi:hypothetical protein
LLIHWIGKLKDEWHFEGPEVLPWGQRWIELWDPDSLPIAICEDLEQADGDKENL